MAPLPVPGSPKAGRVALRLASALFPLLLFVSCRDWTLSRGDLVSQSDPDPASVSCSACHDYPLHDVHHEFHVLFKAYYFRAGRTRTDCRDCHANSIQGDTVWVQDTTYFDSAANRAWSSWLDPDFPHAPDPQALTVRTLAYLRALPVADDPLPIRQRPFREWRTGPAHLNGTVDVVFDSWIGDAAGGKPAIYNPRSQTCSAVLCHAELREYRWPAPSKGLGPLRGSYPDSLP